MSDFVVYFICFTYVRSLLCNSFLSGLLLCNRFLEFDELDRKDHHQV